jgi:protoporphyrin/coproporphyrin ferrochelatase
MKTAILLCNIGTPDAPTTTAVRRYLKEFLSDKRVISLPALLWQPFLHAVILTTRPQSSAKLYQKIWTPAGSPLLTITVELAQKLQTVLEKALNAEIIVRPAMCYGNPKISKVLADLLAEKVEKIIILPMYPQYSASTSAATFDQAVATIKNWPQIPNFYFVNDYSAEAPYLHAIVESIKEYWQAHGKKFLLFSFHGIPQRYIDAGDPYADACRATVTSITQALKLEKNEWKLSFQSRLGPTQWLSPYTDKVLAELPSQGITELQVVCPGFAVDCLETLEEIMIRGKEQFLAAGGNSYEYIPALNASARHIAMLTEIILATVIPSMRSNHILV